jgi:hypothetical protein
VDLSLVGGAVSEDPKNPKNLDEGKTLMFHYYIFFGDPTNKIVTGTAHM